MDELKLYVWEPTEHSMIAFVVMSNSEENAIKKVKEIIDSGAALDMGDNFGTDYYELTIHGINDVIMFEE